MSKFGIRSLHLEFLKFWENSELKFKNFELSLLISKVRVQLSSLDLKFCVQSRNLSSDSELVVQTRKFRVWARNFKFKLRILSSYSECWVQTRDFQFKVRNSQFNLRIIITELRNSCDSLIIFNSNSEFINL